MTTKDFTPEELDLIRKQFFPASGSAAEWQTCVAVARELGLNPILREIHFMPRRQRQGDQWVSRIEPLVGRDGFLSIAHRTGQLAGMESHATVEAVPKAVDGRWETAQVLVAECRVWRKDAEHPFVVRVSFGEYVQKGSDGAPTRFWAEKPETMLKKVAESQALRKAFNIHGVYAPEELGVGVESGGEIVTEAEVAPEPPRSLRRAEAQAPAPAAEALSSPLTPVIAACQAKGIAIEQKGETLFARSYTQRDFLKAQGFRWDGQQRGWTFTPVSAAA